MVSAVKPSKGVQVDVTALEQNPEFARESVNGRFTTVGNSMTWQSIEKLLASTTYNSADVIAAFDFEDLTYLFILSTGATNFRIIEYNQNGSLGGGMMYVQRFYRVNDMGLSKSIPIESCTFWKNSAGSKLRIYFTDNVNEPRTIDLYDVNNGSYPIDELSFSIKKGVLQLDLEQVTFGGSLNCGKYYYVAQAYKDNGSCTDWFIMHSPVEIPSIIPLTYTDDVYQSIDGGNYNTKSNAKVILRIINQSVFTGWKVRIASFLALDELKVDSGQVFYDGLIKPTIEHTSNYSLDTVLWENVIQNTLSIKRVGVIASNGEINTIANIQIDEIENVAGVFDNIKFTNRPLVKLCHFNQDKTGMDNYGLIHDKTIDGFIADFNSIGHFKTAQASQQATGTETVQLMTKNTFRKSSNLDTNPNNWATKIRNYSPGFMDYTNPNISFASRIYRVGEQVRFAFVPYSLYGKPMRPLWLNDLKTDSNNP